MTPSQPSLFDPTPVEHPPARPTIASIAEETRAAIKQVEANADPDWIALGLAAIYRTCRRLPDFICDDIWDSGLESTREDRLLGALILKAKKNGWCVKTDRVRPSKRSHLSGKPVWRSLIYEHETND